MENRREPFIITALVAGMLGLGAAQPAAESDPKPTVAVVSFKGPDLPAETGDAMADELAAQFVETGRYRVMPRTWLMALAKDSQAPLTTLREAAAAANIQYLALGEARYGTSLGAPRRDVLFIDVRVISVATGDVIRTAAGRTQTALPRSRRPVLTPMGPSRSHPGVRLTPPPRETAPILGHLATAAVAVHRAKHRSASAKAPAIGAWKQPIADIAKAIALPGESR